MEILHCLYENFNPENIDLNILNCGIQFPNKYHKFGPIIRDHYILQYIISGEGYYEVNNKYHTLKAGDLFYIPAGISNTYRSNPENPYKYAWVGINGTKAKKYIQMMNLSIDSPILHIQDDSIYTLLLELIEKFKKNTETSKVESMGVLYSLIAKLMGNVQSNNIEKSEMSSEYVQKALVYIHQNFTTDITVSKISDFLSLNRTYFSGIFKNNMGVSPIEYLTQYRIKHACRLLKNTDLPISEIATSVGFSDIVNFSVRFKQKTGYPPREYRKLFFSSQTQN